MKTIVDDHHALVTRHLAGTKQVEKNIREAEAALVRTTGAEVEKRKQAREEVARTDERLARDFKLHREAAEEKVRVQKEKLRELNEKHDVARKESHEYTRAWSAKQNEAAETPVTSEVPTLSEEKARKLLIDSGLMVEGYEEQCAALMRNMHKLLV